MKLITRRSASNSTRGISGTRSRCSTTSNVSATASSACTSPIGATRRAAGPTACCPATGSPTSKLSSARSSAPVGTVTTTWRSSPTTGPSGTRGRTPCGMCRLRSWCAGERRPSCGCGTRESVNRSRKYGPTSDRERRPGGVRMRGRRSWVVSVAGVVALAAIGSAFAATAHENAAAAKKPIVIGWAFDGKGAMAPFDGPALAAARTRIDYWNAKGGVLGHKIVLDTCDTQGNTRATATACALKLIGEHANVIMTTCDVDLAAPVVQPSINHGLLTIAPCIGTDQMGPKRFGTKGRLAFSFGNVAQDEGSAMAQYAWSKGWRKAALATDGVIVYFKNVVQAFEARWKQLGGKIVASETYQSLGGNNVQNVVTRLNGVKADVIVTSTAGAFGALSTLISGLRSLGNNTPVINSWAGDGNYWLPKNPKVTNYWFVTFASS